MTVDNWEYSFGNNGVTKARPWQSHQPFSSKPKVMYLGLTRLTGDDLMQALRQYFKVGSYDLLRKNCNSFSDCAIWFLLDDRLDPRYRGLEKLGHAADSKAGVVQGVTGHAYRPNPEANDFDVEKVVKRVSKLKSSWGMK